MTIGIIPNTEKIESFRVLSELISSLNENNINFFINNSVHKTDYYELQNIPENRFLSVEQICEKCNLLISIGGDGTMLNTAYLAKDCKTALLGINMGKLGFLAEFERKKISELVKAIKNEEFYIEERISLIASTNSVVNSELFAVNDLVIDRGRWPKMIKLTLSIDEREVSTFSADGIIIATPTGSTGYSLSTGGPIISPSTDAITLSPISAHTLNMRPLVLSGHQKLKIEVESQSQIQISADGQRVHSFHSPLIVEISRYNSNLKLFHLKSFNYYELLRKKLFWGLDVRV
jgi:NAD+ kinase